MSRLERLARIAAKMKHPSMSVSHTFHLLTDREAHTARKGESLVPLYPAVSVSPDATSEQAWLDAIRADYRAGLLN